MKAPFLIGRILFGGFFLYNGINHLRQRKNMADYTASKGVPAPEVAVTASAVPLIIGGTSMLLGIKPKWGAMAILGFLAGVSPVMHDFWNHSDEKAQNEMIHFSKNVALLGAASPPPGLKSHENRAFEANILENHPDYSFYTSEHNDGHEDQFCHGAAYDPDEMRPATGKEIWRRWQFVYSGNARVPFWIVRVPKDIIWGHGGLWSDNSVAMLAALFRIEFPLPPEALAALRSSAASSRRR